MNNTEDILYNVSNPPTLGTCKEGGGGSCVQTYVVKYTLKLEKVFIPVEDQ